MIRAEINKETINNRTTYEMEVKGHARNDDAAEGSESVCAAVSCMAQTLTSYLDNSIYNYEAVLEDDGYAYIRTNAEAPDTRLDEIMLFIAIALEQIAYSAPEWLQVKTFIDVTDKKNEVI